jgi:cob(I)alamin adenosyltransferase
MVEASGGPPAASILDLGTGTAFETTDEERDSTVKIYTKTGDEGVTGLLGSRRVPKDDIRIEAYGTVDELNAVLGLARAQGLDPAADGLAAQLQDELFAVGSALADPDPNGKFHHAIREEHAARLEGLIDALEAELPPLTSFILPGGTLPAAQLHLARTVCRRAERLVVKLARQPGSVVPSALIVYLNRLSDLLFVMARVVNHRAKVPDTPWKGL